MVGTSVTPTAKDSNNNSLTLLKTTTNATNDLFTFLFAYDVPVTPSATVNVAVTPAKVLSAVMQEVSGLLAGNTTAMLDGAGGSTASGGASKTGTGALTSPTYSSTASGEYLFTTFSDFGNNATAAAPAGFTIDPNAINTNANANCVVATGTSTGGAESSAWSLTTNSGSDFYCVTTVAFKLAAGGGGGSASCGDTLTVSSTASATSTRSAACGDTLTVSSTAGGNQGQHAGAAETLSVSDGVTTGGNSWLAGISDSLTVTDSATGSGNGSHSGAAGDSLTVNSTANAHVTETRGIGDTLTITSAAAGTGPRAAAAGDTLTVSSTAHAGGTFHRGVSESLTVISSASSGAGGGGQPVIASGWFLAA